MATGPRATRRVLRRLLELFSTAAGIAGLSPRIERVRTFGFAGQLAERFQNGRCFLIGDAAHRMTPRGGTGMNTAIQDGYDIGWRLGWVLRGWCGRGLLDTYEAERRPVAAHNVARSADRNGAENGAADALAWISTGALAITGSTRTGRPSRPSTCSPTGSHCSVRRRQARTPCPQP
jgi:putative polyketide hydroxylase